MTIERPRLIVVCGPPCSGKTTLAAKLHVETELPYLAIDKILPRILPNSSFEQADRDVAYRVLGLTVEYLLSAGQGAIVDGTFARAPYLEDLQAIADKSRSRLFLVECKIDIRTAVSRFSHRDPGHPAADLDEERVERLNRSYPYRSKGLVLDTSRPVEQCLAAIRQHIGLVDS
jgi:predicted kinase